MFKEQSDPLSNLCQQAQFGKMSLITLIQKFPENNLSNLPRIIYDQNGRYFKLKDNLHEQLSNQTSENNIRQQTNSGPVASAIVERYDYLANQFNLSSSDIQKQYELALKNRIEIPPILMRRIIIDAIGILHLMMEELNQNQEKNMEKLQRISKRLQDLETYNQLFNQHC